MDGFGLAPLEGGFSGETFVAESAGERTVVRIYAHRGARRGESAVEIDAAVLRLVRGLLPVPEVLEVRRPDPGTGQPGLLVTSYLPGRRLDELLPELSAEQRLRLAGNLGRITARLAQMPMARAGSFIDRDLTVVPWGDDEADLVTLVERGRDGTALREWPEGEYVDLVDLVRVAQSMLDPIDRVCLVHSDLNPKNLLVDPTDCAVTGLVDWEFSHAGLPVTDLGNLLRFDREPAFVDTVLSTHAELVPDAGDDLLDLARAADLFALVDLASRRHENPVAERAHDLLRAVARSGDLHAVPAPG